MISQAVILALMIKVMNNILKRKIKHLENLPNSMKLHKYHCQKAHNFPVRNMRVGN